MKSDIFEYAMQMEKDGEAYYRDLAVRCPSEGLKNILNLLADDEADHYNTIKALSETVEKERGLENTKILEKARNIFSQLSGKEINFDFKIPEIQLYQKAMEIEQKSEDFYRDNAGKTDNPSVKNILLKLAGDENRHQFLLKFITQFLEKPQTWIENAEFHHLTEY